MIRTICAAVCFLGWLLYVVYEWIYYDWRDSALMVLASTLYGGWLMIVKEGE